MTVTSLDTQNRRSLVRKAYRMPKAKPSPVTAFTVDRKAFADAVGKVARFAPEQPPVPVLRGILLDAEALGVELTATDYADTAHLIVAAEVSQPGRFLLDGALLARILRNLPADTVRVEVDNSSATITSGRVTFRLLTMPTEDYPDMSEVPSVELDGVRPVGPGARENRLEHSRRAGRPLKLWRAPRATREPYEPTDLAPGAWITWTRHTRTSSTTSEIATVTGQVWASAGPRSVWAIAEGEPRPVLVSESRRGNTLNEFPEPAESVVRRRALSEGTLVVEAEDIRSGDMIVGQEPRGSCPAIEELGKASYAGAVVKAVGEKRKNTSYYYTSRGIDAFETPVTLCGDRTMRVMDFHVVRVIRSAEPVEELADLRNAALRDAA